MGHVDADCCAVNRIFCDMIRAQYGGATRLCNECHRLHIHFTVARLHPARSWIFRKGQPIGLNDPFTKHPTREKPLSSQSCQKTSKISHPDEAR
ncbi:hypothetical protein TNCV_532461 [Trichonephila clavipes]|nr:hypothetical protein TNCV_532461 [Trichonephila clavipes]